MNAQNDEKREQIWTTKSQRRLIAAAPELLAALRILEDALTRNGNETIAVKVARNSARAAIAKAEGA